ncbi:MAG: hypothetical protein QXV32_02010 [Conexivisphaerales archaeon]
MFLTPELDFLGKLEHELMEGNGRWIADFSESFRNVRVKGKAFDMFIRGSTRGRSGYFFSALLSKTMLPAYAASCFVRVVNKEKPLSIDELENCIEVIHRYVRENEAKWSLLLLVFATKPPEWVKQKILNLNDNVVGVAMIDLQTMQTFNDQSFIGRAANRVIPKKWKYREPAARELPELAPVLEGRNLNKLALIFGVSLAAFTVLSFIIAGLTTGVFAISRYSLILNLLVSILITVAYSRGRYRNRVEIKDGEMVLRFGRNSPVSIRFADYDLVSLVSTGPGSFAVRMYSASDHSDFVDIPVSSVKADASIFRWTAMAKSNHGLNRFTNL